MILVSISYVAWLADFMRAYGAEPAQLLTGTGMDDLDPVDPVTGISDNQHMLLLRNAMQLSRDPALGPKWAASDTSRPWIVSVSP